MALGPWGLGVGAAGRERSGRRRPRLLPAPPPPPPSAQASAQKHSPHTAYLCIPLPVHPTPTSSKLTNFWKPGGADGWSRGCPEDCTSLV